MSIFAKAFGAIGAQDIQSLIANNYREDSFLDYKRELPGNSDDDRKEFFADVSAFANSGGGIIVYGIEEQEDAKGQATGIPSRVCGVSASNADREMLRLKDMIQHGIQPRISGVEMRTVDDGAGHLTILIKIPKSFEGHMVSFKGSTKFYKRAGSGKHQLDQYEIKNLMVGSNTVMEKVESFRNNRVFMRIGSQSYPIKLGGGPLFILHAIPLSVFSGAVKIDLGSVDDDGKAILQPGRHISWDHRYNIDGLASVPVVPPDQDTVAYVQVFRNGAVEMVSSNPYLRLEGTKENGFEQYDGRMYIPASGYERETIIDAEKAVRFFKHIDISPPIVFLATIRQANNAVFINHLNERLGERVHVIDEDTLILPDAVLNDYSESVPTVIRPIFDTLWQAGGYPKSVNYDGEGRWTGGLF